MQRFGTAAVAAMMIVSAAPVAMAQTQATYTFDIPAQDLGSALRAFGRTSRQQIVFDERAVRSKVSPPLAGPLTVDMALDQLLSGTGLHARRSTAGVIVIEPLAADEVAQRQGDSRLRLAQVGTVAGVSTATDEQSTQDNSSSAMRSLRRGEIEEVVVTVFGRSESETLKEVPQSVMVFDETFLKNTGATDLFNVLRFVPSATGRRSQMGYLPQEFNIRGFYASQTLNGTSRNTMSQPIDMQGVERIEVLMGPASVLYGSMEPGAVVNVVTKQPLDQFHLQLGAEYGSYESQRFTADVGGPLSDRIRARLNLAYQDRESFLNYWSSNRLFAAPVVAFDLSDQTRLSVEGTYARERAPAGPYNGAPAAGMLTANPLGNYDRSFFPANPNVEPGVGLEREAARVEARLTHQLNDTWHARAAVSYTYGNQDDGDMLSQGYANGDNRSVRRFFFLANDTQNDDFAYHLDLAGEFTTGPLSHKFSVGAEYVSERYDARAGRGGFFTTTVDVFNPVYTSTLPNPLVLNGSKLTTETSGVFVQDRVTVADRLHLIGGLRYAKIRSASTFIPAGDAPEPESVETDSAWPTMFGVLYDVNDSVTVFANQSKSFMPRGGSTQGGVPFSPERSVQYELGTKFELADSGMSASVSLFHVKKPNVLTPDIGNPGFDIPLGEVTSKGAELSVQGSVLPGWSIYASYAYLQTEVRSNDLDLNGNDLSQAPGDTVSLMTRYDVQSGPLAGLGFSLGANFVSNRFIDDGNSLLLPSYTRVDVGAYYTFNERVELNVMGNNLTNERIFSGSSANQLELDLPRNVMLRVNYKL
ncbi:TonB-dependent siderophore receptor [Steroidobacter sp.]|uniref:TonB-dependent siderophore receptor n=1 Tax=Steroidobacter sp. TaxID=1978227 RepID=UPI0025CF6F28|nr:TonB-dependent receptor [Steroidobacter sp.]